jgi:hypothetical protein
MRCAPIHSRRTGLALALVAMLAGSAACGGVTDVLVGGDDPAPFPRSDSAAGPPPASEPPPHSEPPALDATVELPPVVDAGPIAAQPDAGPPDSGPTRRDAAVPVDATVPLVCAANTADCDEDAGNGCETDILTDLKHCGGCNRECHTRGHDALTAQCVEGRCELTCRTDLFGDHDCDGDPDNGCETRLLTDIRNCGACGKVCLVECFNGGCML